MYSWTSIACHIQLWKVWSLVLRELWSLVHVYSPFLRVSNGKKVNVFFIWPLECTKNVFLSKSKRDLYLKYVHLISISIGFWAEIILYLIFFMYFLAFFEICIGVCFTLASWTIRVAGELLYVFICYLEVTGRWHDFLFCTQVTLFCTIHSQLEWILLFSFVLHYDLLYAKGV